MEKIIPKTFKRMGAKVEKQYKRYFVLSRWPDIVGEIAARHVHPQGIEFAKLILYAPDATWRQEVQMMSGVVLQRINNLAGERLVKEIFFTGYGKERPLKEAEQADNQNKAKPAKPDFVVDGNAKKENLTGEEMSFIKEQCQKLEDEGLQKQFQRILMSHRKFNHLKERYNWHKCADCGALCPPEKERCSICSAKAQEATREQIRAFLRESPWARYQEIKETISCTPDMVTRERTIMVQSLARKLELKDFAKLEAKTLTMLYRSMPPEYLTDEIVLTTMYTLRDNLAKPLEFKPIKRYDYIRNGKQQLAAMREKEKRNVLTLRR